MKKYLFTLLFPVLLSSCAVTKVHEVKDPLLSEAKHNFYGGDYKSAARDLHALAKAGDPEAQYALGYMYYYGMGMEKNQMIARRLISLSAEKGNVEAIRALRLITDSNHIFANVQNIPPKVDYDVASKTKGNSAEKTQTVASNSNNEVSSDSFKDVTSKDMQNTFKLVKFDKQSKVKSNTDSKTKELTTAKAKPNLTASPKTSTSSPVNSWLKATSADAYTIQLAANKNKKVIDEFINKYNLASRAKIYTYNYNNEQWYAVSLGVYNEPAAAFNVLTKLPENLKANKPWVRQISNIKKEALALSNVNPQSTKIG